MKYKGRLEGPNAARWVGFSAYYGNSARECNVGGCCICFICKVPKKKKRGTFETLNRRYRKALCRAGANAGQFGLVRSIVLKTIDNQKKISMLEKH